MKPKEGEEYTDKKICSKYNQPINEQAFLLVCALLLFRFVTAFHYLPNGRSTFGNVKVTVVPPQELFFSSTVIDRSVAIF